MILAPVGLGKNTSTAMARLRDELPGKVQLVWRNSFWLKLYYYYIWQVFNRNVTSLVV